MVVAFVVSLDKREEVDVCLTLRGLVRKRVVYFSFTKIAVIVLHILLGVAKVFVR